LPNQYARVPASRICAELGRVGGSKSPLTKLRKADDDLREQAREVLAKALRGEEVPKAALDSAKSLYSFRAEQPPLRDRDVAEDAGLLMPDGTRPPALPM
jgi:hypothetical protein